MKNTSAFWHRFWRDGDGNVAIVQRPNLPIILWFIFLVAGRVLDGGHLGNGVEFLSSAALVVWAYLEITEGASYFRRSLGAVIMAAVIVGHVL